MESEPADALIAAPSGRGVTHAVVALHDCARFANPREGAKTRSGVTKYLYDLAAYFTPWLLGHYVLALAIGIALVALGVYNVRRAVKPPARRWFGVIMLMIGLLWRIAIIAAVLVGPHA